MALWTAWLAAVTQLRNASSNRRNFMWFVVVLAGMSIRRYLFGFRGIVCVLGLLGGDSRFLRGNFLV